MAIELKVVTTSTFADLDSVEEFLKISGAFEPHNAIELLEEKKLTVEVEDPNEAVIGPTITKFTLTEK